MAIQRSARHLPAQFIRTAVAIGAVFLACQAQAVAPRHMAPAVPQQSLFDNGGQKHNDNKGPAKHDQHAQNGHGGHGDWHGDGRGPRGRPPVVRPPIHPHPPRPVIVVPPCKRGGPGITPC